jgi:hypothetical protein
MGNVALTARGSRFTLAPGDGHWWPETYYLGSLQARRALSSVRTCVPSRSFVLGLGKMLNVAWLLPSFQVLLDAVKADELTEEEAVRAAKDVLFHTANRVYDLGLEPRCHDYGK